MQVKSLNKTDSLLFRSVTAQLPGEDGYSGGKVIFIDTENTLYPHNDGNNHKTFNMQIGLKSQSDCISDFTEVLESGLFW